MDTRSVFAMIFLIIAAISIVVLTTTYFKQKSGFSFKRLIFAVISILAYVASFLISPNETSFIVLFAQWIIFPFLALFCARIMDTTSMNVCLKLPKKIRQNKPLRMAKNSWRLK